jgi:hypothetical protein
MNIASHAVTREEIMALFDAELFGDRAQFVAGHLEQCAECGDIANALRNSSQSLAGWTVPAMPVDAQSESSLHETARRIASEHKSFATIRLGAFLRRHWLVTALSGACACVVLLVLSSNRRPMAALAPSVSVFMGNPQQMTDVQKRISRPVPAGMPMSKVPASIAGGPVGRLAVDEKGSSYSYSVDKAELEEPQAAPMIARTVSLSVLAKDFGASRAALDAILVRHHGYAASLTANTQQNTARSLQASLRIPAVELNAALAELKALGQVQSEAQNGEEVTQQHADLVARLKNSRETEHRLQAILEQRTGKISDVLAVEQEIARVRGEIEQMEAEQKSLEHRVSFATVDLTIAEEYKAQISPQSPAISTRVHNALVGGYRDAVETLVSIVLFFASYGPSLLIWLALLAPIVWLVWRRWQRVAAAASI